MSTTHLLCQDLLYDGPVMTAPFEQHLHTMCASFDHHLINQMITLLLANINTLVTLSVQYIRLSQKLKWPKASYMYNVLGMFVYSCITQDKNILVRMF